MKLHEVAFSVVQAVVDDIISEVESINKNWAKDFGGGQNLVHLSTHGNGDSMRVVLKVNANFDKDHFFDVLDHVDEMLKTEGHIDGILPVDVTRVRFENGSGSYTVSKLVKD